MKYRCLMFGHKWLFNPVTDIRPHCKRCGEEDYTEDRILQKHLHDMKMEQMQKESGEQHDRVKKRFEGLK